MSRSGYHDDLESWSLIRWRGQVASAIRGKDGQRLLVDLYKALDAMEKKELVCGSFQTPEGEVCALGCLGRHRGIDLKPLDSEEDDYDYDQIADAFEVAHQLAREVMYLNDEMHCDSPAARYDYIKKWVLGNIRPVPIDNAESL